MQFSSKWSRFVVLLYGSILLAAFCLQLLSAPVRNLHERFYLVRDGGKVWVSANLSSFPLACEFGDQAGLWTDIFGNPRGACLDEGVPESKIADFVWELRFYAIRNEFIGVLEYGKMLFYAVIASLIAAVIAESGRQAWKWVKSGS